MSKYLSIFLATALLLVGCTNNGIDTDDANGTDDSDYTDDATDKDKDEEKLEYKLGISNQATGTEMTVNSTTLEAPGFVVIHEKGVDGKPGTVLGASALLEAGQYTNVKITLSRAVAADEALIAMIHIDDGDGVVSETKDAAVSVNDEVLMKEFSIEAAE